MALSLCQHIINHGLETGNVLSARINEQPKQMAFVFCFVFVFVLLKCKKSFLWLSFVIIIIYYFDIFLD